MLTKYKKYLQIEHTAVVTCVEWRRAVLLGKEGFDKDIVTSQLDSSL
jgi:hypothetical protein